MKSTSPGKGSGPRLALRVGKRPDPAQWTDTELMTLFEAAALFWPDGPLSVSSLRTAVADDKLAVVEIAGKLLTSKAAISEMSACSLRRHKPICDMQNRDAPTQIAMEQQVGPLERIRARRSERKHAAWTSAAPTTCR